MMWQKIIGILEKSGAVAAGIAEAGLVEDNAWRAYLDWVDNHCNAGMRYMENYPDIRRDARLLIEGAKSIISMAFPFKPSVFRDDGKGMIACYAYGEDYHDVIRKRLTVAVKEITDLFGGNHRICIDSAPVMERYWAVKAGIGERGDNGSVIVPGTGSMAFLAEIATTLKLGVESGFAGPWHKSTGPDRCTHCQVCTRRCPGGAIRPDGTVDARRCISYLSIEHRGPWIDNEALEAMATPEGRNIIFGCDLCLRICPLNTSIPPTPLPEFQPSEKILQLTKAEIAEMDQDRFSRFFKGSAIKRCKLNGIKRNIGLNP
ncbi:MAG: tRNA epoxyqueuosine(34) reductase QueG [Muribaculaceae bacterium]|nr:tRNA epoxyqueuosine(34) reductase QueG [Muribaculaceae bacterium]